MKPPIADRKPRVCAVSYLNTVPLVWGMLHGKQAGEFDLIFRVPAECADLVLSGEVDIGILPSFELAHGNLECVPGLGIACRGPVRSILLISKCAPETIRTLAADSSSRTSVVLARIILERRFGVRPQIVRYAPDIRSMVEGADAAVIIGDPALRVNLSGLPYKVFDLGAEWVGMTGLPMVFAVWAGRRGRLGRDVQEAFHRSYRAGLDAMDRIVQAEAAPRGFAPELVRSYLTENIVHELGPREYQGLELFLHYARELGTREAEGSALAAGEGVTERTPA